LFGIIPAIMGLVFVIIAFILYIKNRDKFCWWFYTIFFYK
jgi:hypothetical protein